MSKYLSDIEVDWETYPERRQFRRIAPRQVVRELIKTISDNLLLIIDESYGKLHRNILKQSITESIDEFNNSNVRYSVSSVETIDLDDISKVLKRCYLSQTSLF